MKIERAAEILDPSSGERFEEDQYQQVVEACRMGAEALRILQEFGEVANRFHVEMTFDYAPTQDAQRYASRAVELLRRARQFCGM